jgi:type I restriction enzyme S subunit
VYFNAKIFKSKELRMKQGWEVKKLGEICEVFADGDWIESKDQSLEGIRLIQTGNVGNGFFKDRGEKARYISEDTFKRLRCTEILEGDCLLSRLPDPVGRACILPNTDAKMITAVDCTIMRFKEKFLLPKWFILYSLSKEYQDQINDQITGSTRQRISRKNLGQISIPLPPLPEQQRIVAILDEAFVAIERVRANAAQNLKNAKELFDSYLQSVFENRGEGWESVKLSELATDITDGDHMPPPKTETGIPFITISNINKKNYQIDFSDTFTVSIDYYQKLKMNRKPKKGDILYTVTGSYGIPVLVEENIEFCFQRHIGLIRPKETVSSKWLFYWVLSPQAFKQANETATGTAQKTVSLTALRNFIIPKISLSEQKSIVQKLDLLSAETKRLEAIYQQKIDNLEELKKSILQKAFNGELG